MIPPRRERTTGTVCDLLTARRADPFDKELLVADERRLTYGDLDDHSAKLARQMLRDGVAFGTRVGILLPNSPEFVVTWTAITRIGAVAVPISTLSTAFELRRICLHASIHMLVSTPTFRHHSFAERIAEAANGLDGRRPPFRSLSLPMLRSIWMWGDDAPEWAETIDLDLDPDVSDDLLVAVEHEVTAADPVTIIYTSGSTAEPKGVIHTHGCRCTRAGYKCRDSYDVRRGDRVFTQMPFFWVGGLTVSLLAVMSAGATQLTCDSSTAAGVLDFIERERATHVMAWPHLARAMAADPTFAERDLTSVRTGGTVRSSSGGGPSGRSVVVEQRARNDGDRRPTHNRVPRCAPRAPDADRSGRRSRGWSTEWWIPTAVRWSMTARSASCRCAVTR